jgi:hypothetical protein
MNTLLQSQPPSLQPKFFMRVLPLFTWATNLVADHAYREIYGLTRKDDIYLRASTNG